MSRRSSGDVEKRGVEGELQSQLRDLLCLAIVGDHVRWVLTEDRDGELTHWLAAATSTWRGWGEQVARELAASGIAPDGRVRSLAEDIPLNWVPDGWLTVDACVSLLVERLRTLSSWADYRRLQASGDAAELLGVVCAGFEAQLRALPDMVPRTEA
jgi:hypothetical protein